MLPEITTKIMIINKYLDQLYTLLAEQLDCDVQDFDLDCKAGEVKLGSLGVIGESVNSIKYELKQIENAISLGEDMEKGLVKEE